MSNQQRVQTALATLEDGLQELMDSQSWTDFLTVLSKFHSYSANNVRLIHQQCPQATMVAGYQKWKEMGRQVKKGEKSICILAPILRKVSDEDTGEDVRQICGFRAASVFNVSQTDGEPLPTITAELQGGDAGLFEDLERFSQARGVPVTMSSEEKANGWCRFSEDKAVEIAIADHLSPLHRAKTLCHEIAHSLMHGAQDYRQHTATSQLELEAESVAFVVSQACGLDTSEYSFGYIASWTRDEDTLARFKQSLERIRSTAHQVLDWLNA